MSMTKTKRAIGIVRVSPDDDRGGDTRHSPDSQRDSIRGYCKREGWQLLAIHDEVDVSGRWSLDRRHGLRAAIEAVEATKADVVLVARFDRLVRSVKVQAEITERVELAGGDLYAIDSGFITNGNATQKMTSGFLGLVAQYHSDTTVERTREAQAKAIARGIPPWPGASPGYQRPVIGSRPDGSPIHGPLVPDPQLAPVAAHAFQMRADGASIADIREHLRAGGIEITFSGVQYWLRSRAVLGELHFGKMENLAAHPAIVDREVWKAAQQRVVSRGRRATSERLLARLDVLRCATCGARMTVGNANHGKYPNYRCPPTGDCAQRTAISAPMVEAVVVAETKRLLAGIKGRASARSQWQTAKAAADHAQARLASALRTFEGFTDEEGARERLAELAAARDAAAERRDRLAPSGGEEIADVDRWDELSLAERRALIRTALAAVRVSPGRGVGRVAFEPLR
jgi:DNA invertase Pin-like site-specific DNA recombinase